MTRVEDSQVFYDCGCSVWPNHRKTSLEKDGVLISEYDGNITLCDEHKNELIRQWKLNQ